MHHSSNNSIELSLLDVSDSLITTLVLNIANLRTALYWTLALFDQDKFKFKLVEVLLKEKINRQELENKR